MKSFNGFLFLVLSLVLLSGCSTQYDLGNNNNANTNTNANANTNVNANTNANVNGNANDNTNVNQSPCQQKQCGANEVCGVNQAGVAQCSCRDGYWRPASVCEIRCTQNSECNNGQVCEQNRCVQSQRCTNDNDCGNQFCNSATGKCQECLTSANCRRGYTCSVGTCVIDNLCQNDGDCQSGTVCKVSNGTCVQCLTYRDCSGNLVCRSSDNTCVQCNLTADCPSGNTCINSACVKSQECMRTSDCPSGKSCNNGNCVDGCANNNDCPTANPFCTNGTCVQCTSNTNCATGQVCQGNRCVVGCRSNADCPSSQVCTNAKCVVPSSTGCNLDADCSRDPNNPFTFIGKVCDGGQCVVKTCSSNADCGNNRVCDTASGRCYGRECNNGKPMCDCPAGARFECQIAGANQGFDYCSPSQKAQQGGTCWKSSNYERCFPQTANGLQVCDSEIKVNPNGKKDLSTVPCTCSGGAVFTRSGIFDSGGATARCSRPNGTQNLWAWVKSCPPGQE